MDPSSLSLSILGLGRRAGQLALPELMTSGLVPCDEVVSVLAVHVRRVTLTSQGLGDRFKVRVKYGEAGSSHHCETADFTPAKHSDTDLFAPTLSSSSSEAEVGSTCLFLLSNHSGNVIRLRLCKAGRYLRRQAVAVAEFNAGCLGGGISDEVELPLLDKRSREVEVGQVYVAIQLVKVRCGALAGILALTHAKQMSDGFLISGAIPVAQGTLMANRDDSYHGNSSEADCRIGSSSPLHRSLDCRSRASRWNDVRQVAAIGMVPSVI
mmetsp:Transcript_86906/g.225785  ORF Transcript_86906/g.225785 Transcript_86906/m.225785 type:complete len:267 (+) Transcript_86906:37-837(+)|eukprot:CAMPEP_0115241676 /NCGR_PEP_ID=MMETSP0270-20121206/38553_1 /TAXON_ID=71861 /ORGANISM="Scrippsiella trochoidea, Strain CCMP3099" /LENGTH=266 /DNA_ID=CAMNT_0002656705 /DNA_START=34 /DNA_END=834 /DNA_ORIENTATION=-